MSKGGRVTKGGGGGGGVVSNEGEQGRDSRCSSC